MKNKIYKIHKYDSREIKSLINEKIVDVTITSPPYFDLKDYGYKEQIGFGQNYEDYLEDLKLVFKGVYDCTKESGTLWVIIDTFRKNGEVVTLPFDFSNKIKEIGWKLQEIIIWGKDKTVPWAHKGQMRSSFEYVLMFSKTDNYKFDLDKIRDYESLKKWWVKYPERYNPKGKTPDAIWDFPIPTQGSWGKGYIRHFCPLPEDMIAQILNLTTVEGDVVFDPFSGSGAVLAKADNMKRHYIGTELNQDYIDMFSLYLNKTKEKKRKDYENDQKYLMAQGNFETLILQLRALKYGRLLFQKIQEKDIIELKKMRVEISTKSPQKKNSRIVVDYKLFIDSDSNSKPFSGEIITTLLNEITTKPPLSKFGIEPFFSYITVLSQLINREEMLYVYTNKITNKYIKTITAESLLNLTSNEIILSSIMVDINEKDFE